jgi:hypothetical protein
MKATMPLFAFTLLVGLASVAFGQSSGAIGGTILDQSGAAVPKADITVNNTATNVANHVTSLSDGKYLVSNLVPGEYEIAVEAPGFKRNVNSNIEVHVGDNLTVNVSLQVGAAQETVSVTDSAPLLRTEDSQTGEVVDNNFISNMPQLNRNPFALLTLSGDVTGTTTTNGSGQNSIQINGGRTSSVDYYIDGGVVNSGQSNSLTNQQPSMDAVAEFKVVTSGISAEFGRISGGYVTLVTKSGTNAFHGSLYEYMYNDMFNANSWAQNSIGAPKAHFRQNDYGFTLGGPVRIPKIYNGKNKTFFFVDNEYLKNNQAGTIALNSVPNAAERAGNLENTTYQGQVFLGYDQLGPTQLVTSGQFAGFTQRLALLGGDGRNLPASRISPIATEILATVPMPNRPSTAGSSSNLNYGYASSNSLYNYRFGAKIDHNFSDKNRLSFRYATYDSNQGTSPTMASPLYTSNVVQSNGGFSANVNHIWTKSPTTIVEFRGNMTFNPSFQGAVHGAGFSNSFLPAIYDQYVPNNIPPISVSFMSATAYGQAGTAAAQNSTTYNFASSVTKVLNRHTIKFGAETRRYYDNFYNAGTNNKLNYMVDPVYQYSGDWGNGLINGKVTGLFSFLMGVNDQNNVIQPTTRDMNTNYYGTYIQDDWKVNNKLTVSLGLRYDNERPTTERHNKIYFWDPALPSLYPVIAGYNFASALAAAGLPANTPVPSWAVNNTFQPGGVMVAGTPAFPSRTPQLVSNLQFAPRIGISYQLNSKTVIRASGGKMYLPTTGNPSSYATSNGSVPLSNQAVAGWHASTDGGIHYISTWDTPFPLAGMFTSYTRDIQTVNNFSSADPGPSVVSQTLHQPREYDWSFNIQRQLPFDTVVEVGYTGNRGLGLLATDTISHYPANLLVPQYANVMQQPIASPNAGETFDTTITGHIQQMGLLEYNYPYYGRVQVSGLNEGSSTYNAMTVRLEHRFKHGMSVLANYTWSHMLDNVGGPDGQGGKGAQSVESFTSTWGISPLDHSSRLNIAYTYQFPIGQGRHFMGHPAGFGGKLLDYAVGGWQFAGNYSYTTGAPVSLGAANGNVNNGIKVNQTWANYAPGFNSSTSLVNSGYTGDAQVLYSPTQPIPKNYTGFFNPNAVTQAQLFVVGTLPPDLEMYRQPSIYQLDVSFQKNFRVTESKYFQLRAEGQNALNIRGFGNYNGSVGSTTFGLITSAGNVERKIQISARLNF